MDIRRARTSDIPAIGRLLSQVLMVHHGGRPDLFKPDVRKYTDGQLAEILRDGNRPVFVGVDENDQVLGYAFCVFRERRDDNIFTDHRTLYIDDICVDEACRGQSAGRRICEYVLAWAKEQGVYNVTLNVWECNPGARAFYEALGFTPYQTGMEMIVGKG